MATAKKARLASKPVKSGSPNKAVGGTAAGAKSSVGVAYRNKARTRADSTALLAQYVTEAASTISGWPPKALPATRDGVTFEVSRSALASGGSLPVSPPAASMAIDRDGNVLENLRAVEGAFATVGKALSALVSSFSSGGVNRSDASRQAAQLTELPQRIVKAALASSAGPTPTAFHSEPTLNRVISRDSRLLARAAELEARLPFTITLRSMAGQRIREASRTKIRSGNLEQFRPDPHQLQEVAERLRRHGCTVLSVGRFSLAACAPATLVADLTGSKLELLAAGAPKSVLQNPRLLFARPTGRAYASGKRMGWLVDDFLFAAPLQTCASSATHPIPQHFDYLTTGRLRTALDIDPASPYVGREVRVAVIDTGLDVGHPFFGPYAAQLRTVKTLAAPSPELDYDGHGTAMAATVLYVAPGATVLGLRSDDPVDVAIMAAQNAQAQIINCSWAQAEGADELALESAQLELRGAVTDGGCVVVCAAGNGRRSVFAELPEVIAVGGVHLDLTTGQLSASNMTSGYPVRNVPGRRFVADLCALAGHRPAGVYFPMPSPAGSPMDRRFAQRYPYGDGISDVDGWAFASGSSGAAAQVSGVAACLLQKAHEQKRQITPLEVKNILTDTAITISAGNNAMNFPAHGRPSYAVGHGLAQVGSALTRI